MHVAVCCAPAPLVTRTSGTAGEQRAGPQVAGVVVVGPDCVVVGELEPLQEVEAVLPMVALHPGVQRLVPLHVYDMRCAMVGGKNRYTHVVWPSLHNSYTKYALHRDDKVYDSVSNLETFVS